MCQTSTEEEKSKENGKIIQNHQIEFITKLTEYRGGPEIAMNQVKSLLSLRRRSSKWETSMSA
jgi:DNA/RNA endonuclease YhcR with UshA esterase domain